MSEYMQGGALLTTTSTGAQRAWIASERPAPAAVKSLGAERGHRRVGAAVMLDRASRCGNRAALEAAWSRPCHAQPEG
ncbi:MAG: hypothetical protein ACLTDR_15955 [Adlercreutzia equolifaciens]